MRLKFLKSFKSKLSVILPIYLGILCGFYFNIGSKKVSKLISLYCVLLFCSITYIAIIFLGHSTHLTSFYIEYIVRFLLMFCGCGERYLNYMANLDVIDYSIGIKPSYRYFLCSYIFTVIIIIEPLLAFISLYPIRDFLVNLIYCSVLTFDEVNKLHGIMFLESFWARLKFIRKNMQRVVQNVTYRREIMISKINKRLRFYLEVLNNYETAYTLLSLQVMFYI